MTTQSDDSIRMDTPAAEIANAMDASARVTSKPAKTARSNTAAAAQAAEDAYTAARAPVTRELPTAEAESSSDEAENLTIERAGAPESDGIEEFDDGATREVAAVSPVDVTSSTRTGAPAFEFALAEDMPSARSEPRFEQTDAPGDDLDATVMRPMQRPQVSSLDQPMTEPAPPRRYNTLAGAFNRSRASASDPSAAMARPSNPSTPSTPLTPPPTTAAFAGMDSDDEFVDEVDDTEDGWAMADQPTVQWTPEQIQQMQRLKPDFLTQTSEQPSWPPSPSAAPAAPESDASHHDWRVGLPPRPQPPFSLNGTARPTANEQRLAAPDGRVAPEPASASIAGALPDPRMARFQELRRQRFAHDQGERASDDPAPVADTMRQWWSDLRPGLQNALHFQREARASGMHPIPAYEATPVSRMGDAFGRLAASARELSERAQQAAAPTIKRIHDQVEQAAQGIISRFEGDTVRQQAPLLGPGRIAIFFRQGVSVGQAQRLLAASAARPMRLIPRKHGFLARVQPGTEAEVCERLRMHPYVSDVVYLEFNEYGEPVGGRR
ncbi:MAG TPA: hypothetical protein VFN78_01715 [Ktedonobacterales bacterium]|nr:hypothetical protein [Ktedonobacterales bacterium]